ncbi:MAG: MFS transporter [Pseudomonadales bacterium]|nr:MFS transporter [Pseudomonadales bacterium]
MSAVEAGNRLDHNVTRTLTLSFFQVFLVFMPVAVPFFQSRGLSMQEIFSLQALFALVVLLAEVPSGYVADLFGRRITLVLGAAAAGVGNTILVFADGFWGLAAFEIALAIGYSLISGSDIAMLYDTEVALGRGSAEGRNVVGRLYSVKTLSEAIAAVTCSVLLIYSTLQAVVWVQAVLGWLPLVFALRLVEPPGQRMEQSNHLGNLLHVCRYLATHSRVLLLVVLALSIWSLTTFYAVWLLQQIWQDQGIALSWFGYLWAGLSLVAALAGRFAHVLEARLGATALLLAIGILPAFGYAGLDLLGPLGGILAGASFFFARGVGAVVLQDALNRRVPGQVRATANSLVSFGFRGAFTLTGPWVGYALDLWGMSTTLWLLAAVSVVIFLALIVPLLLAVRAQGPVPVPAG